MCKVSETGVVRGSVAPPLVKNGGLVLSRVTKIVMYIVLIKPDNFLIYSHKLWPTGSEIFWFECDFLENSLPLSLCLCVTVCVRGGGICLLSEICLKFLFFKVSGAFGAFNVLENSWNFAHRSEPAAIRAGLKLVPGRGRGAQQRPLERDPNTCP